MYIDEVAGESLCAGVLSALVKWPSLKIALQCGGFEWRAPGKLSDALDAWMGTQGLGYLVLPEYRSEKKRIDIVFVEPHDNAQPKLDVKAVMEIKFNFASQITQAGAGEIANQLKNAKDQVVIYKRSTKATCGYVLHVLASPATDNQFNKLENDARKEWQAIHAGTPKSKLPAMRAVRDPGWRYWTPHAAATMQRAVEKLNAFVRQRISMLSAMPRHTAQTRLFTAIWRGSRSGPRCRGVVGNSSRLGR